MSLLDSKSEFDSRAQQVGLVEEVVQALSDKGIASLAQLGFAAGTPGTTDETSLRAWASETLGTRPRHLPGTEHPLPRRVLNPVANAGLLHSILSPTQDCSTQSCGQRRIARLNPVANAGLLHSILCPIQDASALGRNRALCRVRSA